MSDTVQARRLTAAVCLLLAVGCGSDRRGGAEGSGGSFSVGDPDGGVSDGQAARGSGGSAGSAGAGGAILGAGGATPTDFCGDGRIARGEACEGTDPGNTTCVELGFESGELLCNPMTCRFDTSQCVRGTSPPRCEQTPLDLPQECVDVLCLCGQVVQDCDDECWEQVQCRRDGCSSPTDCSNCPAPSAKASAVLGCLQQPGCNPCGNGVREASEMCDGTDLGGRTCEDVGKKSGSLACYPGCVIDVSGCGAAECGDGVAGLGEGCDGSDFRGATCETLGYPSGNLVCNTETCRLDDSGCERCGDGRVQEGEECDGNSFAGKTCQRFGFAGGSLGCTETCTVDDSGCARCGNGKIEPGESCDGSEFGGTTCESLGLIGGSLGCSPTSCRIDASSCSEESSGCGNGVAELSEHCDGDDLAGLACEDFGFSGGALACTNTCRFDTSACVEGEPPSACRDCRETHCRVSGIQCEESPACRGLLECAGDCSGAPGDFCWFGCGGELDPTTAMQAMVYAIAHFSCVSTTCGRSCAGEL